MRVDKLSSMEKAKKAMLAHVTFVPLRRRKDTHTQAGPPAVSFKGFACYVAEVHDKKVDLYIYATCASHL